MKLLNMNLAAVLCGALNFGVALGMAVVHYEHVADTMWATYPLLFAWMAVSGGVVAWLSLSMAREVDDALRRGPANNAMWCSDCEGKRLAVYEPESGDVGCVECGAVFVATG